MQLCVYKQLLVRIVTCLHTVTYQFCLYGFDFSTAVVYMFMLQCDCFCVSEWCVVNRDTANNFYSLCLSVSFCTLLEGSPVVVLNVLFLSHTSIYIYVHVCIGSCLLQAGVGHFSCNAYTDSLLRRAVRYQQAPRNLSRHVLISDVTETRQYQSPVSSFYISSLHGSIGLQINVQYTFLPHLSQHWFTDICFISMTNFTTGSKSFYS